MRARHVDAFKIITAYFQFVDDRNSNPEIKRCLEPKNLSSKKEGSVFSLPVKEGMYLYQSGSNQKVHTGSGRVAQLVRESSQCAKAVSSISGQGTYKNQPMNA